MQNDISVTKFLGTASTRFLETNDITVTKFLDVTVTKFLSENESAVTKYLEQNDITVTKFLEMALANFLLDDKEVANFLHQNGNAPSMVLETANFSIDQDDETLMIEFLETNGDISVTKFLNDESNGFDEDDHEYENELEFSDDESSENDYEYEDYDENAIMSNDQNVEKNARKKGKKKKNKKNKSSKKPFGGTNEDVVFVEFLETSDSVFDLYFF